MKFIIEIRDAVLAEDALECCRRVILEGLVSGPKDNRQHCYLTTFTMPTGDRLSVSCQKRKGAKSERFLVWRQM